MIIERSLGPLVAIVCLAACGGTVETASVAAPPTPPLTAAVTLRAWPLDGGVLPPLSVRAQTAGGRIDSVAAQSDGSAVLVVPTTDSVDLRVISSGAGAYYSSQARVRASRDTTIDVILVPTHWTVRKGAYLGSEQTIDLVAAFGSDTDDTHFLNKFSQVRTMLVAWSPSSLPISIGFDTTRLWKPMTTTDSANFWQVTNDVNAIIGETVFKPAGPVPFAPTGAIGVRLDSTVAALGEAVLGTNLSRCSPAARVCTAVQGEIWMLRYDVYWGGDHTMPYIPPLTEESSRMIAHELMHTLGFGHACYWPSVMMVTKFQCVRVSSIPTRPTATDVAYIELVFELAKLLGIHPAAWHVAEALAAAQ